MDKQSYLLFIAIRHYPGIRRPGIRGIRGLSVWSLRVDNNLEK